jgi:hypothetical protein
MSVDAQRLMDLCTYLHIGKVKNTEDAKKVK